MKKKYVIITNILLLIWYFLAMLGVKIGDKYLVEQSFKDEWIFMLIPIVTFILYLIFNKIGKVIHAIWLSMWLITQLLSHEWYIFFESGLMGNRDGKFNYFKNCIQLINTNTTFIPDIYHIILHILIILALITTLTYKKKLSNE